MSPGQLRAALRGKVSGSPRPAARQLSRHGQARQAGRRGVQTKAPSSINACAKSPERSRAASRSAAARNSGRAAGNGVSTASSRLSTRSTLASTATTACPPAIAATAAAV